MADNIADLEGYDLPMLVFEATCQIPEGMVSTYGDIAIAMGDVRAARVVGTILSSNPRPIVVPCHRVVYGDGRTGWYSGLGKGAERKTELLRGEGVPIADGVVQEFASRRFRDFKLRPVLKEMQAEQERMSQEVREKDEEHAFAQLVGLDVSYTGDEAFAAAVIYDMHTGKVEQRFVRTKAKFPYVPSYLGFREVPAVAPLLQDLKDPLVLVDGQGRLHPRRFGIACHLGVRFDVPSVGVAKSLLSGVVADDGWISLDGARLGKVVSAGGKDYYVSVGNRITLKGAVEAAARYLADKESDVLRQAHVFANKVRRETV